MIVRIYLRWAPWTPVRTPGARLAVCAVCLNRVGPSACQSWDGSGCGDVDDAHHDRLRSRRRNHLGDSRDGGSCTRRGDRNLKKQTTITLSMRNIFYKEYKNIYTVYSEISILLILLKISILRPSVNLRSRFYWQFDDDQLLNKIEISLKYFSFSKSFKI